MTVDNLGLQQDWGRCSVATAGCCARVCPPARVPARAPTCRTPHPSSPARPCPWSPVLQQPAAAPAAPAAAAAPTPGRGLIGGIVGACSAAVAALKRRLSTAP